MSLRSNLLVSLGQGSAGGNPVINDTFIGNGESLYFAPKAESVQRAIVRGTCSLSINAPTPDEPAIMSCNNGDMQFVDGVLTISGSPSTFDYNEARLNPVDLFGWGYADEQNVLTGVITRKVQVSAMRASWDWVQQSISGANYFALPKSSYPLLVCTHFHQVSTATPANVGEWCEGSGDYLLFNYDGTNDNLADFEDYLEECYQANEAVICLTKRFVDITETETAFPCVSVKGLNSFKYEANDDSNVCLKYRAVYPADNKIWYETTDGTQLTGVRNKWYDESGNLIEFKSAKLLGNNIIEEEYKSNIRYGAWQLYWNNATTRSKLKRLWLPSSFCGINTLFSDLYQMTSLANIYVGTSMIRNAISDTSYGYLPSIGATGSMFINIDYRYNKGIHNLAPVYGCNTLMLNIFIKSGITTKDFQQTSFSGVKQLVVNTPSYMRMVYITSISAKFVYFPLNLLNTYKTELWAKNWKHKQFPIPDCWL